MSEGGSEGGSEVGSEIDKLTRTKWKNENNLYKNIP